MTIRGFILKISNDEELAEVCKALNDKLYEWGIDPPHYPVPAIIYEVTLRPLGTAIWRDYDGPDGDRYTIERQWFWSKKLS